jgi:Uma2 family endonuclease
LAAFGGCFMIPAQFFIDQIREGKLDKKNLPTMYDLPSEDIEEPGLPDEFHDLQPQLLSATFRLSMVANDRIFTGTDLNLYYDLRHPLWHKRPDWFAALNVPRLYDGSDLRLSYVAWQEGVNPSVIVELLSPGTEKEDLGETISFAGEPPTKWEVYEQILKVPYYILYDRYSGALVGYQWIDGQYQTLEIENNCLWLANLKLGLGLWQGEYLGIACKWLRWIDARGQWIPTPLEQAEQQREQAEQRTVQAEQEKAQAEQQRKQAEQRTAQAEREREQARHEAARLAAKLRELGIDPNNL